MRHHRRLSGPQRGLLKGARAFLAAAIGISWCTGCTGHREGASPPTGVSGSRSAPWFEDATDDLGLDFRHDAGPPGSYFMPEVMGSGAALLDYDGDSRLDIYLLQNAPPESGVRNRLFHQGADGRFSDASEGSGLDVAGRGMGAAVGDVNNDGRSDVLVTEYGGARLFVNQGGKFIEVTREAGIDNPHWGASASFFDYDRDGWLDLVIANYVLYSQTRPCTDQAGRRDYCGPQPFPGTALKLFRNLGARGSAVRFLDVTLSSGLGTLTGPGLGVVCADFTGDRWPDVLVANDGKPNFLWVNRKNGTFEEEAVLRGLAYNGMGQAQADMGIAIGDVNGDGLFDLYITHLTSEQHVLLRQGPRGQFIDDTAAAGLAAPAWRGTGFGTVFGDFDHDGDLDLAQANGRVTFLSGPSPPGSSFWDVYMERSQLFENDGSGKFGDVSASNEAFSGPRAIARALACADIDGDGDLDLLVSRVADRARLYRNCSSKRGSWLIVRAVDDALGGRDAYGAEVTVTAGGKRRWGLVNPGHSYLSSSDPRVHFGLGSAARVDSIEVAWPDGTGERFGETRVNQAITLHRGAGTPMPGGLEE